MSASESWFCMHCLEDHQSDTCPIFPHVHRPLDSNKGSANLLHSLVQAIAEQTKAINALAESNQALVQAMLESDGVDAEKTGYQTLD